MIKRKLQDLTACCAYQVNFLHAKEHDWREFRRQYEVLEEIGRGGFGVVYAGTRIADEATVAIKFIEHRHVREWTLAGSHLIPSEVSHLECCSDVPGCIKLYDWFANSKGFVVIMERPKDACDVFDLVTRYGRLDEETARSIFLQVVETVCQMYARHGLIHRDIKDENIIVSMETGEVRLVDFGATAAAEKAVKKEFQGTRSYCPPEWFRMLQYLPLEATSWSLGVLLYILVTGTLPFKNEVQACLGSIAFPSYLSKEICQLIKRCLCTVPSQRATLAEISGHSWLAHPLPLYEETFEEYLDAKLKPKTKKSLARDLSMEENRLLEDRIIMGADSRDEREATLTDDCRMRRESTEYLEAFTSLPRLDCSTEALSRLASKYDNVSASSLADYYSLSSFATAAESFSNLHEEEESEPALDELSDSSTRLTKARSLSAYSLSRRRRSILPRSSFERELDTVEESDLSQHDDPPLLSSASFIPSISESFSLPPSLLQEMREREPSVETPETPMNGYANHSFYRDSPPPAVLQAVQPHHHHHQEHQDHHHEQRHLQQLQHVQLQPPPSPAPTAAAPPHKPQPLSPVAMTYHRRLSREQQQPPSPSPVRPRFSLEMESDSRRFSTDMETIAPIRVISRMRPLFVSEAPPALAVFAAPNC
ncbi:prk-1 [Pristionchus pacificus]|uniref:Serine/threonine-protein kinase 1 n=1 Tax=Pristionchus pacificus TaxID=54126 RepID=A0A2A6BAT3_PRIPA|nr:prk-1 [Pristionchus pacificus]|eukprot:PDM62976.1 prk-1 [Pristionchus pacificus]